MIYESDPERAPDSDFVPGEPALASGRAPRADHLVARLGFTQALSAWSASS